MVLKTIFVDSPLYPIYGLDQRRNSLLARMAIDYVHERWAAHRRITPELWRLVVPFVDAAVHPAMLLDLQKGLAMDDLVQRQAIGLCCFESGNAEALALLAPYPELRQQLEAGELDWAGIGDRRKLISSTPVAA
jgi:hypothetical protein